MYGTEHTLGIAIIVFFSVFQSSFSIQQRADQKEPTFFLGRAQADITPQEPIWLSGFSSRSRPPQQNELIASRAAGALKLRVLLLRKSTASQDSSPAPLVLLALDLIGIDRNTSNTVFQALETATGISRGRVRLCFSHTHSGPFVGDNLEPLAPEGSRELRNRYVTFLIDTIVRTVKEAMVPQQMISVAGHHAVGQSHLAVNRGQVEENAFDGKYRGTTDSAVPVLWFSTANEDGISSPVVVAGIFGYAAHATMVTTGYIYHGDYPAEAVSVLEKTFRTKNLGQSAYSGVEPNICTSVPIHTCSEDITKHGETTSMWLYLAGAGGDQNIYPRGTVSDAKRSGSELAKEVMRMVETGGSELRGDLLSVHDYISLPYNSRLSVEELKRMSRTRDATTKKAADLILASLKKTRDSGGRARLSPKEYEKYPVSLWQIGELTMAFLGGEPTVGYSHTFRKLGINWTVGYADDVMGYVGTADVLEKGMREGSTRAATYYGLPSTWASDVEDVIRNAVVQLSDSIRAQAQDGSAAEEP